jgi:ribosomal protein L30E
MDGKAIGGTVKNPHNRHQQFTSLVSVFSSKQQQVLATGKVELGKKSEIATVKQLIEMLDLKGVVFSLDALHCQKDTVKTIVKSKNHYVISVKGNQKKLYSIVKKT